MMNIIVGLFDNMVLQRNNKNVSAAGFSGESNHRGILVANVYKGKTALKQFKNVRVGVADGTAFSGRIIGLAVGGPYTIMLAIIDTLGATLDKTKISNVLVGDVWVLAGQSNMEGIGRTKHALPPHAFTRAFYMDDRWDIAADPLHQLDKAVDKVHLGAAVKPPEIGVGPGVAFAQELFKRTNIPQGLIACAHGGTFMSQWDPKLAHLGSGSFYGAMLRRIVKNGGAVAGFFWYQGCSEAGPAEVPLYTPRMRELVDAVRCDCRDKSLPVIMVQIARVIESIGNGRAWNAIQEQQRLLPKSIKNLVVVPAIDLDLDDSIHLAGDAQNRLGLRCAQAALALKYRDRRYKAPITFKNAVVVRDRSTGLPTIVVSYKNVVGHLVAPGRPSGFDLSESPETLTNHYIWKTTLAGDRIILNYNSPAAPSGERFLFYGFGTNPYCNITDAADRSLPVMGMVPVIDRRLKTSFAQHIRISNFFPSPDKLQTLSYPSAKEELKFTSREYTTYFCSVREDIVALGSQDRHVFYALSLECPEPMKLAVWLGYDGPLKVWIDGKIKLHDPHGTNPALPEDAKIVFTAEKGVHEIMVALGTNHGLAWGIFLQLERLDVKKHLYAKNPEKYPLPKLLG
ncbi:MAG: sialate O-acetylesterase [Chitinivibrionales bacterium]|nr:sialate O-acetylesterase [Chitinivibrionales bacterium]